MPRMFCLALTMRQLFRTFVCLLFFHVVFSSPKIPTQCEVCRLFSIELLKELDRTGGSSAMLETGHRLDPRGNYQASGKIPYRKSELRLLEALEQVCAGMYAYDLQDDDKSAFRYHRKRNLGALAELMSQLSSTTNKLGISNNMETLIDPRGDLKVLKTKCSGLIEDYEDDITEWYMSHQDKTDLTDYLCAQRVAKKDHECLTQRLIDTFDKTDDKEIDDDDDDDDEEEIDADTEDEGQETSDATDASNEGNTDEDSNETTDKHTEL